MKKVTPTAKKPVTPTMGKHGRLKQAEAARPKVATAKPKKPSLPAGNPTAPTGPASKAQPIFAHAGDPATQIAKKPVTLPKALAPKPPSNQTAKINMPSKTPAKSAAKSPPMPTTRKPDPHTSVSGKPQPDDVDWAIEDTAEETRKAKLDVRPIKTIAEDPADKPLEPTPGATPLGTPTVAALSENERPKRAEGETKPRGWKRW